MNSLITSIAPELGATQTGSAWCMKALHPSDASVEVVGLPDKSAVPSVMLNYQSTARVGAPNGATGTWNFASTMTPHPVAFGVATLTDDAGTSVSDFEPMLNQQLEGADHNAKMITFLTLAERWRLAYFGVSIHFDGPALANQGTIVVNQTAFAPRRYYTGSSMNANPKALVGICSTDAALADLPASAEFPNYDRAISMPNCYTGQAKDGAYIPLKLTKTCQQWRSKADLEMWVNRTAAGIDSELRIPSTPSNIHFPYAGLGAFTLNASTFEKTGGAATSPLLSDVVAHVCGRNISVDSALIFTFRVGIEAQVEPGSLLSPYQHVSPVYDAAAIKAYFIVARELKDAYPVSYNDLGKLWGVISAGLKAASLPLSAVHPALGVAANATAAVGDMVRQLAAKKRAQNKRSGGARSDGNGSTVSAAQAARNTEKVVQSLSERFAALAPKTGRAPKMGKAPRRK